MLASRILAVNGNPLRRRVDRYESWVKAILVITFLAVGPLLGWQAGLGVYHSTLRSISQPRPDRYPVDAVMVSDPVTGGGTGGGTGGVNGGVNGGVTGDQANAEESMDAVAQPRPFAVRARWTGPDGTEHSEAVVPDNLPRRAGDVVRIWTDEHGNIAAPPPTRGKAVGNGLGVGLITLVCVATLFLGIRVASGRAFERRRLQRWDADWLKIEPQWSGRR